MITYDPECQEAVDRARRAVPKGDRLGVEHLIPALCHMSGIRKRLGVLADSIPQLVDVPGPTPENVPESEALQPILARFAGRPSMVNAVELLLALAESEPGKRYLARFLIAAERERVLALVRESLAASGNGKPQGPIAETLSCPRNSRERKQAIAQLESFGRILTNGELPEREVKERDGIIEEILLALRSMGHRSSVLVGPSGTGKTAIVYELARRLARRDPSIHPSLQDLDIFELSPTFLRSGASLVGQYEERVKTLLQVLKKCPGIVLFVDEIHSMFQSGVHERGPFSDANQAFKTALSHGELTCIGCTTPSEYRHFIEPDEALVKRLPVVRVEAPSRAETIRILQARRAGLEKYYAPLKMTDALIERVVDLTDEYLPSQHQPGKSIQILDRACAAWSMKASQRGDVGEEWVAKALEAQIGSGVLVRRRFTEQEVLERLSSRVFGQKHALQMVAAGFMAGLGAWRNMTGPRGVFVFGGPTGVGKTETALALAEILGRGQDSLVRVDCSTLQASGHDLSPIKHLLLGPPPGYLGYARGQGGMLTRIRNLPESIVLFDEFEKADPRLGELLLRVFDEGKLEDMDGNILDFRRSFIILTTNAGLTRRRRRVGFPIERETEASVSAESLRADLMGLGHGPALIARLQNLVPFKALDDEAVWTLAVRELERLRDVAQKKGYELSWSDAVAKHIVGQWKQDFGVRHLRVVLRNRVIGQISVADADGQLTDARRIRLEVLPASEEADDASATGARRKRDGDTLIIELA